MLIIDDLHPADHTHPIDLIWPEDELPDDPRIETLKALMALLLPAKKGLAQKLRAGWVRYVALCFVIRPDLLDGRSQLAIAKELGVSSATISKHAVALSTLLGGFRSAGMLSDTARENHRKARLGKGLSRDLSSGGAMTKHKSMIERNLLDSAERLANCQPLKALHRALLTDAGYIVAGDALTEKGKAWFDSLGLDWEKAQEEALFSLRVSRGDLASS